MLPLAVLLPLLLCKENFETEKKATSLLLFFVYM
jgi:hypothetical protein